MECQNQEYLAARFVGTALHTALVVNVLSAEGDHVLFSLPANCLSQALQMPPACRKGTCAMADALSASCRQTWQARPSATASLLHGELIAALVFLVIELVSMLSAVHTFQAEGLNFLGAVLHGGGALVLLLFLLMQTSCAYFHIIFVMTNVLPFLGELKIWTDVLRGARPKRFPAPEMD
ncbi:unnamed protein product [Effrenium voratum]|nr:unnamed protein product [Effrenium voratum]